MGDSYLSNSADIPSSGDGRFDLFYAQSYEEVMDLVSKCLDVNERDEKGYNALYYVTSLDAVKALVRCGIRMEVEDLEMSPPVLENPNPQITRFLLEQGVSVEEIDIELEDMYHPQQQMLIMLQQKHKLFTLLVEYKKKRTRSKLVENIERELERLLSLENYTDETFETIDRHAEILKAMARCEF